MKFLCKFLFLLLFLNIGVVFHIEAITLSKGLIISDKKGSVNDTGIAVFDGGNLQVSNDIGDPRKDKNIRLTTPYEFATCDIMPEPQNSKSSSSKVPFATDFYVNSYGNTILQFNTNKNYRDYVGSVTIFDDPILTLAGKTPSSCSLNKKPTAIIAYPNISLTLLPCEGVYKVRFRCNKLASKPAEKRTLSVVCTKNCGRESMTPFAIAAMFITSSPNGTSDEYKKYVETLIGNVSGGDPDLVFKLTKYFSDLERSILSYKNSYIGKLIRNCNTIDSCVNNLVYYQNNNRRDEYFATLNLVNILSKNNSKPEMQIDHLRFTMQQLNTIRFLILGSELWSTNSKNTQSSSTNDIAPNPLEFNYNSNNSFRENFSKNYCDIMNKQPDLLSVNPSFIIQNGAANNTIVNYDHFVNYAMPNCQRWGSIGVTKILNDLLKNSFKDDSSKFNISYNELQISAPYDLILALIKNGHKVELQEVQTYANFISYQVVNNTKNSTFEKDSILPVFVDMPPLNGSNNNTFPLNHKEYDINITGPDVNARVTFFLGMNGVGFWSVTGVRPLWSNARIISVISTLDDDNSISNLDPLSKPSARAILTAIKGMEEYYKEIKVESSILLKAIKNDPDGFISKIAPGVSSNLLAYINNLAKKVSSLNLEGTDLADDGYGILGACVDTAAFIRQYLQNSITISLATPENLKNYLQSEIKEFPLFRSSKEQLELVNIKPGSEGINDSILSILSGLPHHLDDSNPIVDEINLSLCAMRNTTYDSLKSQFNDNVYNSYSKRCKDFDKRIK